MAQDQSATLYLLYVVDEMIVTRSFDGTETLSKADIAVLASSLVQ